MDLFIKKINESSLVDEKKQELTALLSQERTSDVIMAVIKMMGVNDSIISIICPDHNNY